jgi:hypothetical protein
MYQDWEKCGDSKGKGIPKILKIHEWLYIVMGLEILFNNRERRPGIELKSYSFSSTHPPSLANYCSL